MKAFLLLLMALLLTASCTQMIRPSPPPQDLSLEELVALLQKQQEEIPPLKGLMKVTIKDKGDKGFWGKWSSVNGVISVDGYNLLGGTLFNLKVAGSEVSLNSSENNFNGSREALEQYLAADRSDIRIEWVTLLDWIARGGLPDLSTTTHFALRKEVDSFVLSSPEQDIWIDRKSLRTKMVMLHHVDRPIEMRFDDYRFVDKTFFPFFIQIESHDTHSRQMEIVFKEVKAMTP